MLCQIGAEPPGLRAPITVQRDFWNELGIRPFINAAGTYTTLTASRMPPEVMEAMNWAAKSFVHLDELHDAIGRRIASLIGCEAAMVPAGAASGLLCGTAACITGTDPERIRRLPDTAGMKSEVIIQSKHRFEFDSAVRACGARFVEVGDAGDLRRAVNSRTAMMLFFNDANERGRIRDAEFAALGRELHIPTMNDAAADVPPVENLSKYTRMGFDLVVFSGGKGIRGPQGAGLLIGRRHLIEAARMNTSPNSGAIARGHKVSKEELLAMMVAVERYLNNDHHADRIEWERRARLIRDAVATVPTLRVEIRTPPIANHVPHLHLSWDPQVVKLSYRAAARQLVEGTPSIETTPGYPDALVLSVWMLEAGEAEIVAARLRQVLDGAR